jgi:hypothetical protein
MVSSPSSSAVYNRHLRYVVDLGDIQVKVDICQPKLLALALMARALVPDDLWAAIEH